MKGFLAGACIGAYRTLAVMGCIALWLGDCFISESTVRCYAADSYFDGAMEAIEKELVDCPDSYGLVITDLVTSTSASLRDPIKASYAFFVSGDKVRYDCDRYEPDKIDQGPYVKTYTVSTDLGKQVKVAEHGRDGTNMLRINDTKSSFSVGEGESYEHIAAPDGEYRPDRVPYQILRNPCFAPLGITPIDIADYSVTAISSESGLKAYEIRDSQGPRTLRLWRLFFSPEHGNQLAGSEEALAEIDSAGELKILKRTTRTVASWQTLPNGEFIPERFTLHREKDGKRYFSLERQISNATIGSVDGKLFDTARLPEFNVKWTQTVDAEALRRRHDDLMAGRLENLGVGLVHAGRSWIRFAIIAGNVVLVVLLMYFILKRRLSKSPS